MSTITPATDLTSIGTLASRIARSVRAIERAAVELEVVPSMRINMVPYFDAEQVEQITNYLHHRKESRP